MTKTITFHVGGPYISKTVTAQLDVFPLDIIRDLCHEVGIVEYIWFGLEFTAPDGLRSALNISDRVGALQSELTSENAKVELRLLYFPTSHSVVLQPLVKEYMMQESLAKVLDESVYAPIEMILVLLAHDLQVVHGDCEDHEDEMVQGLVASTVSERIPRELKSRHNVEQPEWESTIMKMWKSLRGYHRMDTVESFMEEVEKLQMHNTYYFVITNPKKSSVYVGVEATGLSIFSLEDKQTPKISFEWNELSAMEYKGSGLVLILREKDSNNQNSKLIFNTSGKYQGYRIGAVVRVMYDNHRNYLSKVHPKYQQMKDDAAKLCEAAKKQKEVEIAQNVERTKDKIQKSIEETKKTDAITAKRVENVVNKLINVSDGQDTSGELYEKLKDINKAASQNVSEETKKTIRMNRRVETASDAVYEQQEKSEFTKFQTLARLRVGNTRSRVEQFECI